MNDRAWQHPWLRVQRLIRSILEVRRDPITRPVMKATLTKALRERERSAAPTGGTDLMPRRQHRSVIGRRCCTLIVLNVIAGLVAGCVFHTQYPRDWPALAAKGTDHCPSMTGYFENFFSETTGPKDLPPLSVLLGIDRGGRVLEFVQNPDQKLVVRATDSSGSIIIEEKALDYTCDEDGIQLGGHYGIHSANVVGTISRESLRLTRATDGSLVVRRQSTDFVLILGVIPGGFVSGADWYRFAPWKPRPFGSQDLSGSDPH